MHTSAHTHTHTRRKYAPSLPLSPAQRKQQRQGQSLSPWPPDHLHTLGSESAARWPPDPQSSAACDSGINRNTAPLSMAWFMSVMCQRSAENRLATKMIWDQVHQQKHVSKMIWDQLKHITNQHGLIHERHVFVKHWQSRGYRNDLGSTETRHKSAWPDPWISCVSEALTTMSHVATKMIWDQQKHSINSNNYL